MRLRITALGTALLLAAPVLSTAAVQAAPVAVVADRHGASGVGDPYFPRDGNGGIDVLHYDIHDTYAFRSGRLAGRTRLDVRATEVLTRFDLDFLLPVTAVSVDGRRADWDRAGDHELRITPRHALAAGSEFRVVVEYAGTPATESSQGESNWLADRREVVAMNEPHMATWWFPANDHPSDKATYDIAITTAKGKDVVANGDLVSRSKKRGRVTTAWSAHEPMASYLAFFAAGDFAVRTGATDGIPWTVAVSKAAPAQVRRGSMALMLRSGEVTSWLQSVLGAYPFSSTGGLVTALPVGFALENQTRPTYPLVSASDVTLIVHELAHQWFGDSVSVAQWRDIWLNEGFASFVEEYWNETHGGPTTREWLQTQYGQLRDQPELWRVRIDDPGRDDIFDNQVYSRGALALAALRSRIGDASFWATLRGWTAQHRHGNGRVGEFEALAEQTSGQDLDAFFDAWLHARRAPAATADNGF